MQPATSGATPPSGHTDPVGNIGIRHIMPQSASIRARSNGKKAKGKKARGEATIVMKTRGGKGNSKQKTIGLHSNKSREKMLPRPK